MNNNEVKIIIIRALKISAIVGSILNSINQWEAFVGSHDINIVKLVLTYIVPFCVSSFTSWLAYRRSRKIMVSMELRYQELSAHFNQAMGEAHTISTLSNQLCQSTIYLKEASSKKSVIVEQCENLLGETIAHYNKQCALKPDAQEQQRQMLEGLERIARCLGQLKSSINHLMEEVSHNFAISDEIMQHSLRSAQYTTIFKQN